MIRSNITKVAITSMATLFFCFEANTQKNDHNWLFGFQGDDITNPVKGEDTLLWGATNFDFNHDPVKIYRDKYRYTDFLETNASYSLGDGRLFSYSNGHHIYASDDSIIEGGDSTLYGNYWEYWVDKKEITGLKYDWLLGLKIPQSILYLPCPGNKDHVYMLNQLMNFSELPPKFSANSLFYSLINTEENAGKGYVVQKDIKILDTLLSYGYVQATKHANGRDWWITVLGYRLTKMYSLLLDPNGIHMIHSDTLDIGWTGESLSMQPYGWSGNSWGQSTFSQDGSKYAMLLRVPYSERNPFHTIVMDFDRCTGKFSNIKRLLIEHYPDNVFYMGLGLSPSGRYLYTGDGWTLYQFDLTKANLQASKRMVGKYDGFKSDFDVTTQFYRWLLGPDGRLYGTPQAGSSHHMHIIDYPDESPLGCGLRQHGIRLPTSCPPGMPNFPNYRLGPLDGSSCDTLGLNNNPIAKYRYEPDTIDYKRIRFTDLSYFRPETWSWDFGDGSPKISIKSPYHTFPKDGTYKVCLTVSNENSSNTSCRDITIGVSATDDESEHPIDVNIFPNPVQDVLLVTIGEYIPAQAYMEFYSALGQQVHKQRLYYGHNNVDMTALPAGVYAWRIVDRGVLVKSGEVVKI